MKDYFFYSGIANFELKQPFLNIVLARIHQINLDKYITIDKNKLFVKNNFIDSSTRIEYLIDLLTFIEIHGNIYINKLFFITKDEKYESIQTKVNRFLFTFQNQTFFYEVNETDYKEKIFSLNEYNEFLKHSSYLNHVLLNNHSIDINETRFLNINNLIIPYFEPLILKNNKKKES